jgi:hypothetical protein
VNQSFTRGIPLALHIVVSAFSVWRTIMRFITTSLLMTTALLGLCVSQAHAQTRVIAKVPFEFTLQGQQFPAGTYEIREAGNSGDLLAIQGEFNNKMTYTFAQHVFGTDPAGDRPALVFNRQGNHYVLTAVWDSANEGLTLPVTKHGSEVTRADQGTDGPGELTYVIAASLK